MEIMPLLRGEPTLAPIHDVAPLLRRYNIYFNFITNGLLFTRAYFEPIADITSRLHFSLHTHRRDLYKHFTPKLDFDVVIRNIRDAVDVAKDTGTHILTCICPVLDMLDHMEEYVTFVAGLGVQRIAIQKLFPQTLRYRELDPFKGRAMDEVKPIWRNVLKTARKAGVYIESNFEEFFNEENIPPRQSAFDILHEAAYICDLFHPDFCISTALNSVVEYDGSVIPCVNDRIVLGNLHETRISEIWNGKPMQDLRQSHFDRRLRLKCETCKSFHHC
jgi:radical SAM protein with 4Fe4S-binding SPASM domain